MKSIITGITILLLSTQAFSEDKVREYHLKGTDRAFKLSVLENILEERYSDLSQVSISSIRRKLNIHFSIPGRTPTQSTLFHNLRFTAYVDDQKEAFKCLLTLYRRDNPSVGEILINDCKNKNYSLDFFLFKIKDLGITPLPLDTK